MTYGLTAAPMLIKKLKKKSKTHESDFVIDLGVDRLFRRIGLFGLSALAFVVKFMDSLEGAYLSCFPLNSNRRDDADLIKFSSSYCWDTSHILTNNGSCEKHSIPSFKTTQNPEQLKWLVHVLPYAMLVQALLLVGASSLWKSCFGAILKGDLHFLRLRLEDILNKDKVIQEGVYPGASFDEANASFDGMKGNFNGKKRGKNPSTSCTNEETTLRLSYVHWKADHRQTEPLPWRFLKKSRLIACISDEKKLDEKVFNFPCRTQAVEWCVKNVTKTSIKVYGKERRDCFIRATIASGQNLPRPKSEKCMISLVSSNKVSKSVSSDFDFRRH